MKGLTQQQRMYVMALPTKYQSWLYYLILAAEVLTSASALFEGTVAFRLATFGGVALVAWELFALCLLFLLTCKTSFENTEGDKVKAEENAQMAAMFRGDWHNTLAWWVGRGATVLVIGSLTVGGYLWFSIPMFFLAFAIILLKQVYKGVIFDAVKIVVSKAPKTDPEIKVA